jgi:hypothetical protein
MNLPSNILTSTSSNVSEKRVIARLPQYVICAGLGLLGGAIGVALAIGLAILIQSALSPMIIFSPDATHFMAVGTLMGIGVSWLLGRVAQHVLPSLSYNAGEQGMQVILIFSVLASLLNSLLFFTHGF